MTTVSKVLFEAKDAETSLTEQYAAPTGVRAKIDKITATNTTGASITIDVHLVAPLGTAGATNKIIGGQSIPANSAESLSLLSGHDLMPGGKIFTTASAAGLNIRGTGRETS